eukprot:CAMPEP_0201686604 /NCGR_PEP_ID=MMETSP0578-20130828/989_1 /ASSEMBLY_ACC=CAM_ASM_000663 /TAXON_ID=267565 /ORGANISM="Skeletonema grethea, Strain CCMP 1804" /LENGTH=179 /DNA_ID=CAMNT_0048170675 /DNA_START=180 /DNA_END=719 /DNA_ORIENTATION=-
MPLGFKKVATKKKASDDAPISAAKSKSADQLESPPEVELSEEKDRVQLLEKELAECKAELLALKESAGRNNEEIDTLKQQISEVTEENVDLKKWIKELRGENSDMKKVFGNLDDLGELRHQFEELFEEDFKSSHSDVGVDNITSIDPAASEERRQKTNYFCNDMKAFILDVRTKSLSGQ